MPQDTNAADYLAFVQSEQVAGGELSKLTKLVEAQAAAQSEVADLEAKLTKAREILRDLAERQVPEFMDAIGQLELKTTSGLRVKIQETIRASIPNAQAQRAFAWLKEHGHAAMLKRKVSVSFGKGEDDKATELLQQLVDKEFEPDDVTAVHPSTLSAWVREKLQKGDEIPLELFGVHRQRVSKIDVVE